MKYEGVWDAEKVYRVGDFVTDGGSLWHCSDTNIGAAGKLGCVATRGQTRP